VVIRSQKLVPLWFDEANSWFKRAIEIEHTNPGAHGSGELQFWSDAVRKHPALRNHLPDEALRKKLATDYLQTLASHSAEALRVIDKSTFNLDHHGVIHSVFPSARIIYVRRDAIDTCPSCYFHQFSTAHNFTMDLGDLAHYYRQHQRLIAHWRTVLPAGTLLEVPYAELVANQETWTRRILGFLDLPWDERCLQFHLTQRPVSTGSFWQVRQKLYQKAVDRWRNYRRFIGPLRELREV
jgi:Sulfotransferase family